MPYFNHKPIGLGDDFLQIGDKDYIRISSIVNIYEMEEYGDKCIQIILSGAPTPLRFDGSMEEFQVLLLEHQARIVERKESESVAAWKKQLEASRAHF